MLFPAFVLKNSIILKFCMIQISPELILEADLLGHKTYQVGLLQYLI